MREHGVLKDEVLKDEVLEDEVLKDEVSKTAPIKLDVYRINLSLLSALSL